MRQTWNDPALRYSGESLGKRKYEVFETYFLDHIWTPDTYVDNAKAVQVDYQNGPLVNQGLRIYPDGTVLHSMR